jgi:hypothetical protein
MSRVNTALTSLSHKELFSMMPASVRVLEMAHRGERDVRLGGDGKLPEVEMRTEDPIVGGDFIWGTWEGKDKDKE